MVKTIIIFIGIQASGKSFYYKQYLSAEYERVNLDELHTRNKEEVWFNELLNNEKNIVIDNTNPTAADRLRYIIKAKEAGYHVVGYFFESRVQDCIKRNALRTGKAKVPNQAIAATSNKLEMPSYKEGFDELYFIGHDENGNMIKSAWRENQ